MNDLLVRGVIGGGFVVVITLLARTQHYYLAGLLPLFPTFGLMSHYIVGTSNTPEEFREVIVFGMWSLAPYLAYLTTVYHLHSRTTLNQTLAGGVAVWAAVASVLVYVWKR